MSVIAWLVLLDEIIKTHTHSSVTIVSQSPRSNATLKSCTTATTRLQLTENQRVIVLLDKQLFRRNVVNMEKQADANDKYLNVR